MDDLAFRSAARVAHLLADKAVSSREILDLFLRRVDAHNPAINAVVTLDVERAVERASAADDAIARGQSWGPLHGLPMTVKDSLETAGLRTTAGTVELRDHVPGRDADAVARLRAAGAIVFGKTNTPPWTLDVQTFNDVFGVTRNPWDPERAPGGSSGGAAAALAAGLTALELGSDFGGSIRNPAHYCGVYGHKPTYGIVPHRGHLPPPPGHRTPPDVNVVGPLARSAEDLALALDVLAGPEGERGVGWRLELPPARHRALRDFRVAVHVDDPDLPIDAAVAGVLWRLVDELRAAGVRVEEAFPALRIADAWRDYLRLRWATAGRLLDGERFAELVAKAEALDAADDSHDARYTRFSVQRHREWLDANERREDYREAWSAFFRDYDVLLCPVTPVTAIPHDHRERFQRTILVNGEHRPYDDQLVWPGIVGLAYLPATVAPAGLSGAGLPVGVQIVGPYLEDRTPIAFAQLLDEVTGGFQPPPGLG